MSDYIKRADAIKAVKHLSRNYTGRGKREDHPHIDFIIDEIKYEVPSADVVPVVRCKDCKMSEVFQNDSSGVMARYCKAFTLKRMVADDDYCSYGERKDDEID